MDVSPEVEALRSAVRIILENVGVNAADRRLVKVHLGDLPPDLGPPPDPKDVEIERLKAMIAAQAAIPAAQVAPATINTSETTPPAPVDSPPNPASVDAGNSAEAPSPEVTAPVSDEGQTDAAVASVEQADEAPA